MPMRTQARSASVMHKYHPTEYQNSRSDWRKPGIPGGFDESAVCDLVQKPTRSEVGVDMICDTLSTAPRLSADSYGERSRGSRALSTPALAYECAATWQC